MCVVPRQAGFAKKISCPKHRNNGLFALFGNNGQFDAATLDVENSIPDLALGEDFFVKSELRRGSRQSVCGKKYFGIKSAGAPAFFLGFGWEVTATSLDSLLPPNLFSILVAQALVTVNSAA